MGEWSQFVFPIDYKEITELPAKCVTIMKFLISFYCPMNYGNGQKKKSICG